MKAIQSDLEKAARPEEGQETCKEARLQHKGQEEQGQCQEKQQCTLISIVFLDSM